MFKCNFLKGLIFMKTFILSHVIIGILWTSLNFVFLKLWKEGRYAAGVRQSIIVGQQVRVSQGPRNLLLAWGAAAATILLIMQIKVLLCVINYLCVPMFVLEFVSCSIWYYSWPLGSQWLLIIVTSWGALDLLPWRVSISASHGQLHSISFPSSFMKLLLRSVT